MLFHLSGLFWTVASGGDGGGLTAAGGGGAGCFQVGQRVRVVMGYLIRVAAALAALSTSGQCAAALTTCSRRTRF